MDCKTKYDQKTTNKAQELAPNGTYSCFLPIISQGQDVQLWGSKSNKFM